MLLLRGELVDQRQNTIHLYERYILDDNIPYTITFLIGPSLHEKYYYSIFFSKFIVLKMK